MKSLYLIYHEIRPSESRYSYVVSCSEFERQCELFSRLQNEPPVSEIYRPELTFDDGHISAIEYALPVLAKSGLRARFFITAGWTGDRAGYMTSRDLLVLQDAGMLIGAHGWSHQLLTHCSAAELRRELGEAKAKLEDVLGKPVTSMSLPGGRANAHVLRACAEAGYTEIFTSVPQVRDPEHAAATTGRLNLRGDASIAWVEQLLQPTTGVLARLQRVDQVKSAAKAVLGDRLYASLWSIANRQEADPADAGAHVA
ncbi:MAG: polysaccharide deacetylase family protein [Janthinobacterium lividum]